jgi:hypothetical protein
MFVELIKRTLDLWEENFWLKSLNKEIRKLEKYRAKVTVQEKICIELHKEYVVRFREKE